MYIEHASTTDMGLNRLDVNLYKSVFHLHTQLLYIYIYIHTELDILADVHNCKVLT